MDFTPTTPVDGETEFDAAEWAKLNAGILEAGATTADLAAGTNIILSDVGGTTTISTPATVNSSDADLKNRANHTGSQAISTVTGLQTALDAKVAKAAGVGVVTHGATAGTARPSGYASIMWIGSVEPTNAVDGTDTWLGPDA